MPGRVWAGLTDDWYIGGLPNPLQIKEAINDCYENVTSHGYHTDNIYIAGHSLGGIVVESYAKVKNKETKISIKITFNFENRVFSYRVILQIKENWKVLNLFLMLAY